MFNEDAANSSNAEGTSITLFLTLEMWIPFVPLLCKRLQSTVCRSQAINLLIACSFLFLPHTITFPGYHWDCSDWAPVSDSGNNHHNANGISGNSSTSGSRKIINLHEISSHEVRDSESNSDNSQIELTGEDVQRLNGNGLNGRRKGFVGSSSSSIDTTSVDNSLSEVRRHNMRIRINGVKEEDEEEDEDDDRTSDVCDRLLDHSNGRDNNSSGLAGNIEDIEFVDTSPCDKYVTHPNSYLPVYHSITDVNGSDGGFSSSNGSQWISSGDVSSSTLINNKQQPLTTTGNSTTGHKTDVSSCLIDKTSMTATDTTSAAAVINGKKDGTNATSELTIACDPESTLV